MHVLRQRLRQIICPFEPVAQHIPDKSQILDIGCGTGPLLFHLLGLGKVRSGLGIDVSKDAIALANQTWQRLQSENVGVTMNFGTPEEGQDNAQKWDVVLMIDVIHHIPVEQQKEFLFQAMHKVAPGGIFVYKDMCRRPWWKAQMNRMHDLVVAREWIHYVPFDSVISWAAGCGLSPRTVQKYSKLWYGHELAVFHRPDASAQA